MAGMNIKRLPESEVLRLWNEGDSGTAIARHFGVSLGPITRILRAHGVDTRRPIPPKNYALDPTMVADMHVNQKLSVKKIAEMLGTERHTVNTALRRAGVEHRGRSEAMFVRMSNTDADGRAHLTRKANAAARGRKASREEREKSVLGRYRNQKMSKIERVFYETFARLSVVVESNYPVGVWSCDFAIPDVKLDIEIDPGCWHRTPMKRVNDERREAELTSIGWRILRWSGKAIRMNNPELPAVAETLIRRDLAAFIPT
jgi:very-short-patch-repair endonuclease